MPSLLTKIEHDYALEQAQAHEQTVVEKTCRVSLAADWPTKEKPRAIELPWCRGRGFRKSILILRPGKTIEQPLDKCRSWFGPFDMFEDYEEELKRPVQNEKLIAFLRDYIAVETARYLDRWGYPYLTRGLNPDMTPIGPHRSPDISITVLDPEGEHGTPIRLYKVYQIGEFDTSEFKVIETEKDIRAKYEAILSDKQKEIDEFRRGLASVTGMVKGFIAGKESAVASA